MNSATISNSPDQGTADRGHAGVLRRAFGVGAGAGLPRIAPGHAPGLALLGLVLPGLSIAYALAPLLLLFSPPRRRRLPGWAPGSVLLFVVLWVAAVVAGVDPGAGWLATLGLLPAVALYAGLVTARLDHGDLRLLSRYAVAALLLVALMLASAALGAPADGPQALLDRLELGGLLVPNNLALWAVLAPLVRVTAGYRMTLLLALLGCMGLLLESRLSVMTVVLMMALLPASAGASPRRLIPGTILVVGLALILLGTWLGVEQLQGGLRSLAVRWELWGLAWNEFQESWALGQGPLSFVASGIAEDPRSMRWPHSLPLETLATLGLIGTAALVAMLLCHGRLLATLDEELAGALRVSAIAAVPVVVLDATWLHPLTGLLLFLGLGLLLAYTEESQCKI